MKPHRFAAAMFLALLCLGIAAFFVGKIFLQEQEYQKGDSAYESLEELVLENPLQNTNGTEEEKEPETEADLDEQEAPSANFDALEELAGDAIGWLYLPDSVINYPVMQSDDNSYYLHHLADGTWNINGSLFLDCQNSPGFTDENSVIYGHHMKSGKMFGTLESYHSQSYYEEHPFIYLTTKSGEYRIEVFSAYTTTNDSDAYTLRFATKTEYGNWLKEVSRKSEINTNLHLSVDDSMVTLSTCAYSFYDARFVVQGKLVQITE